ncbi:hotdog fold thioesterase [Hamadaea tsunoensis]|uniref:hotdog fold thioesterase n=1 Tax=Hamadaea tsunoensis TaxID=53368 RepID=UPI0003FD12AE|nr:hotdog fold thioesterase [Hamadaea tsunoensis]
MSVTILVPSALRVEVEGAKELSVEAAGTLGSVFDAVDQRWPRLGRRLRDEQKQLRRYVNVYVDGEDCRGLAGLATPVRDGAEVQVLPSVAGGSIDEATGFSVATAGQVLAANFAPWVLDLGLVVTEVGADFATLRLPWSARLAREGGALSGQALMAAADTATVIAISSARGGFAPMTTVELSSTFQRPVVGEDVLVTATLTKTGRTLAFARIDMTAGGKLVAQATTVYALL